MITVVSIVILLLFPFILALEVLARARRKRDLTETKALVDETRGWLATLHGQLDPQPGSEPAVEAPSRDLWTVGAHYVTTFASINEVVEHGDLSARNVRIGRELRSLWPAPFTRYSDRRKVVTRGLVISGAEPEPDTIRVVKMHSRFEGTIQSKPIRTWIQGYRVKDPRLHYLIEDDLAADSRSVDEEIEEAASSDSEAVGEGAVN